MATSSPHKDNAEVFRFKDKKSFEERRKNFMDMKINLANLQAFVPVIVGPSNKSKSYINKSDIIATLNPQLSTAAFQIIIRKRLKIKQEEAVDFLIGKNILNSLYTIGEIYNAYRDEDGYLYVSYI